MANDNLKPIHFDFDKANIRPADAKLLDASAKWLAANPNQILLIEGHCDERGTEQYNLALGRSAREGRDELSGRAGCPERADHARLVR